MVGVAQLDALAKTTDFIHIYIREIEAGKLRPMDVGKCLKNIHYGLPGRVHGNESVITIRHRDFVSDELAVVKAYYKLQDTWENPLQWKEVGRDGPQEGGIFSQEWWMRTGGPY